MNSSRRALFLSNCDGPGGVKTVKSKILCIGGGAVPNEGCPVLRSVTPHGRCIFESETLQSDAPHSCAREQGDRAGAHRSLPRTPFQWLAQTAAFVWKTRLCVPITPGSSLCRRLFLARVPAVRLVAKRVVHCRSGHYPAARHPRSARSRHLVRPPATGDLVFKPRRLRID